MRYIDGLIQVYLVLHLVLAVLFDGQAVLPETLYHPALRAMAQDYARDFGDDLVTTKPAWFRSMIWMEQLVQVPWILVLLYGYMMRASWLRVSGLAYGVHVATTMPGLLGHFAASDNPKKWSVVSIYAPFAVFPAIMIARFAAQPGPHRQSDRGKKQS